jgi:hypothetical protein
MGIFKEDSKNPHVNASHPKWLVPSQRTKTYLMTAKADRKFTNPDPKQIAIPN